MGLLVIVLAGLVLAPAAAALTRRLGAAAGWALAALPAAITLYSLSLIPGVAAGRPVMVTAAWAPQLGLNLSFRADGLSLLFTLLISGMGTLVFIYAGSYLKGHPQLGRFFGWLLVFMAAMLGVALADNMLLLFIFWELTSLSSFMLIGFNHQQAAARNAAQQALLVTGGGGLALLGGLLLLGQAGGTLELSALTAQGAALRAHPLYLALLLLVLAGAFTKSAQFPFHFWLPNAMEAPTPVSAYLHSATMVKVGVYLLARLSPTLGGTAAWLYLVGGAGALTMIVGALLALRQTDLKRLLAYTTLSALGMLTMLIGLGTRAALSAALVLFLAHGLYKGALFLVAGILDHETGTREVTRLGGLFRALPRTGVAAALAAGSMAGLPPLFGFIAKELTYEAGLHANGWLLAATVTASLVFVFVALVVGLGPFWGAAGQTPKTPHEAPAAMWLGPALLGALSLLVGLVPGPVGAYLLGPALAAVQGEAATLKLALWHGVNPAFLLSLGTLAGGAALFAARRPLRLALARVQWPWGPDWLYEQALTGLITGATALTRRLQSGYLRYYLLIILTALVGLVGATLVARAGLQWPALPFDARFYEIGLAVVILAAALQAITTRSRLGAVAALGAAGYCVALIFLLFGAPDLALTQFLIESLTVILFVLAFYHLPNFAQLSSRRSRLRDAGIALLVGSLMTALVLSAVTVSLYPSIADYFVTQSLPLAHGRNIVNVILVDFRGLDTLGEITVLSIAAAGVVALLKLRRQPDDQG